MTIVVCGEALLDVFAVADTPTGVTLDGRVGGSPFNVAVGLARLGVPASFFASLSTGFLGDRLLRALRDEGVGTEAIVRVDAPTTLGLVGLDTAGVPSYAFYGESAADRLLGAAAIDRLPAEIAAIHLGSYAAVVEPVAGTLRLLVERLQGSTTTIAYDPNVRLNVEPDVGRWREALAWFTPRVQLLKISDEDLGLLHPGREAAAFAADALAAGARLVVVTEGARGARAWSRSGEAGVAASTGTLVDTVGAGDSFQAALLTWLAEHRGLDADAMSRLDATALAAALAFAAHAAAITCSRRGADPPRRHELPPFVR